MIQLFDTGKSLTDMHSMWVAPSAIHVFVNENVLLQVIIDIYVCSLALGQLIVWSFIN